jgi:hypothetical protein
VHVGATYLVSGTIVKNRANAVITLNNPFCGLLTALLDGEVPHQVNYFDRFDYLKVEVEAADPLRMRVIDVASGDDLKKWGEPPR